MSNGIDIKIKGDASGFQKEWKKVQGTVANTLTGGGIGISSAVGGVLGGLSIGAIVSELKSVVNELDNIGDVSKKLGLTTDEFQLIDYAAKKVGASGEDVGRAFKKMNSTIYEAANGGKEAGAAMYYLGLNAEELMKKSKPEQWKAVGDALSNIKNETERNELANVMLGKSYQGVLQVIKELPQATEEFKKMNLGVDSKDIQSAENLADAWLRFSLAIRKGESASGIIQEIEKLTNGIEGMVIAMGKFKDIMPGGSPAGFIKNRFSSMFPAMGTMNAINDVFTNYRNEQMGKGEMSLTQKTASAGKQLFSMAPAFAPMAGLYDKAFGLDSFGGAAKDPTLMEIKSILDARLPGQSSTSEVMK